MNRFVTLAVAAAVLAALPHVASGQGVEFFTRPEPPPEVAPTWPRREAPQKSRRAQPGEASKPGFRPKPEPPPRPRPPPRYWPYYYYGERRAEPPEREVVVIERPAPAPEAPPEPPAPVPRIDSCRTDPAPMAEDVGSGRVRFMDPPEDGCPRFSRAPAAEAPRLPTMGAEPAQ